VFGEADGPAFPLGEGLPVGHLDGRIADAEFGPLLPVVLSSDHSIERSSPRG
jgi:hypothetical protein